MLTFARSKLVNKPMRKGIHPENYRFVVFKDMSNDYAFLGKSTAPSGENIKWEDGNEYPLIKLEISHKSHPFFTGKMKFVDSAGRIDKFRSKYKRHLGKRDESKTPEQESGKGDADSPSKEKVEVQAKENVEETPEVVAEANAEKSNEEVVIDSAVQPAKDSADKSTEDSADKSTEDSADKSTEDSEEKTTLETTDTTFYTNVLVNPTVTDLFINTVDNDFHLITGSPAINAGDPSHASSVPQDLDEKDRTLDGTPDLGVYEFE